MGNPALGEIGVKFSPALNAQAVSQAAGGIVYAGVDDLGVARGSSRADRGGGLQHQHILARPRERCRNRQPDSACSHDDDVNVH